MAKGREDKMLEQFKKVRKRLREELLDTGADCTRKISELKVWKACCCWVLQKAGEHINIIDFMQEIANEAGVSVMVTEDGVMFEGGIVDELPRKTSAVTPLKMESMVVPLSTKADALGTPEDQDIEAAPLVCGCNKLLNEVCMACAKPIVAPKSKTLLDKEITHHCKHVRMVGNTMQTCINDGQLCVSYSKCCNYEKGNKI